MQIKRKHVAPHQRSTWLPLADAATQGTRGQGNIAPWLRAVSSLEAEPLTQLLGGHSTGALWPSRIIGLILFPLTLVLLSFVMESLYITVNGTEDNFVSVPILVKGVNLYFSKLPCWPTVLIIIHWASTVCWLLYTHYVCKLLPLLEEMAPISPARLEVVIGWAMKLRFGYYFAWYKTSLWPHSPLWYCLSLLGVLDFTPNTHRQLNGHTEQGLAW